MARWVKVAAAQLGPINEGTGRDEVVDRMLTLLEQTISERVDIIAYPEMARWDFYSRRHPQYCGLVTEPVRKTS